MGNASMTYKEVVDEYKLQITKKDARIQELEKALEFYATIENWVNGPRLAMVSAVKDGGTRATEALKEGEDG